MKLYKTLLAAFALALSSVALTGCNEEEVMAPIYVPSSDLKANTTIEELKSKYWKSDDNYYEEIGLTDDGEHVIVSGRVVGNDLTGNIYQNVMVQDATGALCFSVAMKELHLRYKIGEEVFVDCTGLFAGKYAGLFCVGKGEIYEANNTPQVGRMDEEVWLEHSQVNGLPDVSKINVIDLQLGTLGKDDATLKSMQSQYVKIENVSFVGGGTLTWGSQSGESAVNRQIVDANGKKMVVRNSSYASFSDQLLPEGNGTVRGILGYFNGTWQLQVVTNEDCTDFGGESYAPEAPTAKGDGSAETPFNVGAVINGATGNGVWVTGYIVGWIDGMSFEEGMRQTVPASSKSNLVLSDTPDAKDASICIPVQLPSGVVRDVLNLQTNPTNLGKQVSIKGNLTSYFGSKGLKEATNCTWGDKGDENSTPTPPDAPDMKGDGSATAPFSVDDVKLGATGTSKWVTGYIVGWVDGPSLEDGSNWTVPATAASNLLLAASPDVKDVAACIPIQLVSGSDVRGALNLVDNPANLGKQVTILGNITTYFGVNGLKETTAYAWGDKGDDNAAPDTPEAPEGSATFKKVNQVTAGKQYIMVVDGKMGAPISASASYGRLSLVNVTINGDQLTADVANAITVEAVAGGYTLTDSYGRKLAMDTSHFTSFQLDYAGGEVWTVVTENGMPMFKNQLNPNCAIVRSGTYTNIAPSDIVQYPTFDVPVLYEKI